MGGSEALAPKRGRGAPKGVRQEYKLSTSRLIQKLWALHGGIIEVSSRVLLSNQSLVAYARDGRVPFEHIGPISRALGGCSVWGLDYRGLLSLQGVAPPWVEVVNSYGFPQEDVDFILKGATPQETL